MRSADGWRGGKGGGGREAEAPTNNYTYRKSLAILVTGNRIKRFRRIWDDLDVIFNDDGSDSFADFYEAEVDAKVKALTALIEPLMIVFVGGIVGFIVVAMYLPMFSIYEHIR